MTTESAAESIELDGFKDREGQFLTEQVHKGVWFSDRPLDGNEIFGGAGELSAAIVVESVPEAEIAQYEWIEDEKPYREWLIPASVINHYPRRRVSVEELDEIFDSRFPGHPE